MPEPSTLEAVEAPVASLAPDAPTVVTGAPTPAAPHLAPLQGAERIEFIDMLRGLALFGILAANMRGHNAPAAVYGDIARLFPGFADRFAQGLLDVFVSGKFITLFAGLFGLGFAVQMSRAEARGVTAGSFYPRRLLVLLGFGLLHGAFVWWGDILVAYALMGFVLLAFRRRAPRTLLRTAGGILLSVLILISTALVIEQVRGPRPSPPNPRRAPAELARVVELYRNGPAAERLAENTHAWTLYLAKDMAVLAFLPTFLFGLWLWRRGVVQDLPAHVPALRRVCQVALPAGLAISTFAVFVDGMRPSPRPRDALLLATAAAHYYGPLVLALGYAAGLALLAQRAAWQRRLSVFAPVGRMALTNYVMQSVLCLVFYVGTGLYGRVGPAWGLVPTFALYGAQVWMSRWWLARYRFGPLEYVWRVLTYGRLGPLRRAAATA